MDITHPHPTADGILTLLPFFYDWRLFCCLFNCFFFGRNGCPVLWTKDEKSQTIIKEKSKASMCDRYYDVVSVSLENVI